MVATLASVVDGDCAAHVMTMMLGQPPSFEAREELRIEVSDYLIARVEEPWMQDVTVRCQEHEKEDVLRFRSGDTNVVAAPVAPAPAVAEVADQQVDARDVVTLDEETFAALRWASKSKDASHVLGLFR